MIARILLFFSILCFSFANAEDLYYLGQRIPDINRAWGSNDYQRMIDALIAIEKTQNNALPRRSGEFTGPIYERMVNPDNFRPQLNIYSPLDIRQSEAREVLFKLKELMRLYFDFDAKRQPYGMEALGLMTYSLREQAILFTLMVEFWTTLSQTEQRNPQRLQGMQDAKNAAAMLISSGFDYLDLTAQFEREDLALYATELAAETPTLFVHLPAEMRISLLQRVSAFARNHPYLEVQRSMQALLPIIEEIQVDMETGGGTARNGTESSIEWHLPSETR